MNATSCPTLARTPEAIPAVLNPLLLDIEAVNFDNVEFPRNQTGAQFDDYWETVASALCFAKTHERQNAAEQAIAAWSRNYRVEGNFIRKINRHSQHESANPHPQPPIDILEMRAKKAAALGVDARAGDVSKALRTSPPIELTDDVEIQLRHLYPNPEDDAITFEPKPLQGHQLSRHRVARYVMSRSRRSHPGTLGLNFGILQLICART